MHKYLANTGFVGKYIHYLPSCHSTNDIAREILSAEDPEEGTVVITDDQSKGKGQRGNSWESEPGKNLTLSLILRPGFLTADLAFYLNIVTSLAIVDTFSSFKIDLLIKWPNDLYFSSKKISGILIENFLQGKRIDRSIVGIGINLNQRDFRSGDATSYLNITGQHIAKEQIFDQLMISFEKYYGLLTNRKFSSLKNLYLKKLIGVNEIRQYRSEDKTFMGVVLDVMDDGRLVIKTGDEVKYFQFKEIEFIK